LLNALKERELEKRNNKRRCCRKTADPGFRDGQSEPDAAAGAVLAPATPARVALAKKGPKNPKTAVKKPAVIKAASVAGERFSDPSYSTEWSRQQFMARTGFRGAGQSRKFRWGTDEEFPTMAAAKKAVEQWVQDRADPKPPFANLQKRP